MMKILEKIDQLRQELDAMRPFEEHMLIQIREYFRISLTYSSNAIEGNSLTESETKVVIENGLTIGGKPLREHYEAIGHSNAFDMMYELARGKDLSENDVQELHRLFYHRIDKENAGNYRSVKTIITGSHYPLPVPEKIHGLMQEFFSSLHEYRQSLHPVVFAAKAHKDFVFIHPFVDGNGRLARLITNVFLLQAGYSIVIIPPLLRSKYIQYLEKAHTDDSDFIEFIGKCLYETQKDLLRMLKGIV